MNKLKRESAQFDFSKKYLLTAFLKNPFYFLRKNLYLNIKELAPNLNGKILDFGCGAKPYKNLFTNCKEYIGLDIEESGHNHKNEKIDVYYDGRAIPFENESIDNIFSSEVYEHVNNIDDILDELYRVLKKGGYMLATVPFVWNEHEVPFDYHRYTSYGISELLKKHGFKIIEIRKSTNFIEMIYQMKAEYFRYTSQKRGRIIRFFTSIIIIPFQILKGKIANKLLPEDWSFYGNNIILCKK